MKDKVHQTTQASIFMSWKYELTMNWCTMSSVNAHCAALPSLSPATQKMRPLHSSWPDHPFPGLKAPAQLWNYTTGLVPPVYLIPLLLCRFTLNCYLVFCTSHPLPPGCKVMINSCPTWWCFSSRLLHAHFNCPHLSPSTVSSSLALYLQLLLFFLLFQHFMFRFCIPMCV